MRNQWYDIMVLCSNNVLTCISLCIHLWNVLGDSGRYLPTALSTDNVKICDQLEKTPKRLKVNKVWHRAVLKAVSISWVCTLSSPLGYLDSNSNMRHAHTSARTQTHTQGHKECGLFWCCRHMQPLISTHCNPWCNKTQTDGDIEIDIPIHWEY